MLWLVDELICKAFGANHHQNAVLIGRMWQAMLGTVVVIDMFSARNSSSCGTGLFLELGARPEWWATQGDATRAKQQTPGRRSARSVAVQQVVCARCHRIRTRLAVVLYCVGLYRHPCACAFPRFLLSWPFSLHLTSTFHLCPPHPTLCNLHLANLTTTLYTSLTHDNFYKPYRIPTSIRIPSDEYTFGSSLRAEAVLKPTALHHWAHIFPPFSILANAQLR